MTRVRIVTARERGSLIRKCDSVDRIPPATNVVERVGVNGRSLTFRGPNSTIVGCDRSLRARPTRRTWCGGAGWQLRRGTVSDPRLDLCYDRRNRAVIGFAWINPVRGARWIVVDQPGYREVYAVADDLPVRVSTIADLHRQGQTLFRTTQYDAKGVLLVKRKVVAAIAS